jgi:esterase/lipase
MKRVNLIKIPINVFTAGDDHLIDPEGYEQFKKLVPQAKFIAFDNSRHEIFNSDETSRKKYFFYDEKNEMIFVGNEFEAGQVNLFDNSNNPDQSLRCCK